MLFIQFDLLHEKYQINDRFQWVLNHHRNNEGDFLKKIFDELNNDILLIVHLIVPIQIEV